MRKSLVGLLSAAALVVGMTQAGAQDTIKIGLVMTLSGQFADAGLLDEVRATPATSAPSRRRSSHQAPSTGESMSSPWAS